MAATVWKGYISFGLVSFPVRLLAAARPKAIHFHMLHKTDLSRIKEVFYCAEEDKPITRADIVKGTEMGKGEYVVVTDEELKKIAPATATTMEILQFVEAGEVDPILLESSYYVAPEENVSKPYALLLRAMADTEHYAVAKITMHGREHVAIIRPGRSGLVLHTMYFGDELNRANAPKIAANGKFSGKEMDLAKSLITSLAAPFKPDQFHDEYRANVERLLEAKKRGRSVTASPSPRPKPVVNILEALQQSLKQTAKPSARRKRTQKSKAA